MLETLSKNRHAIRNKETIAGQNFKLPNVLTYYVH